MIQTKQALKQLASTNASLLFIREKLILSSSFKNDIKLEIAQ